MKYRIGTDTNGWTLEERRVVQDKDSKNYGKESWAPIGYYARVENAAKAGIDKYARDLVDDGKSIVDAINEAHKAIDSLLKGINK